jgi:hypothetical protein
LKEQTLAQAKEIIEQNYGTSIPQSKWLMLCKRFFDEEWTEEQFKRTLAWFLDTKHYPSWTIADWFDYNVKLYPFAWVRDYCNKNGLREVDFIKSLDVYIVNGVRLYRMMDGTNLPLERVK